MKNRLWIVPVSLVGIGNGGCGREEISGPGFRCVDEVQAVQDLNAINHLGFSAQHILDLALGLHEAPLHWRSDLEGWAVKLGPEIGPSSMTLELSYAGDPIHLIVSHPEKTDDGRSSIPKSACPDRLEVPVSASIRSAQGALNERIDTTIAATMPKLATLEHRFTLDTLGGSLHVTHQDSDSLKVNWIEYSVGISPFGISGNMQIELTDRTEKRIESGGAQLASFPRGEDNCTFSMIEAPFDHRLNQFSGADIMQRIAETQALNFRWEHSGQSTPLHFEMGAIEGIGTDDLPVCFSTIPNADGPGMGVGLDIGTAQFRAPIRVFTQDGNLDATFWTQIIARPVESEFKANETARSGTARSGTANSVGVIELEFDKPYASGMPRQEFLETYTIVDVDVSTYKEAGISFFGLWNSTSASGTFSVFGLNRRECRTSTKPNSGCVEVERVDVAQATWDSHGP